MSSGDHDNRSGEGRQRPMGRDTRLTHAGSDPFHNHGIVNPPVYHASTIVFPTLEAYEASERTPFDGTRYGRWGTPTTFAFEEAVARLEGGYRTIALPSGLAAITTALFAFLQQGDHLLMVDSVYGPTRRFCDRMLAAFGVETTYYPADADIAPLLRPNTRVVFLESPGSLTFDMQDVAAVSAAAHAAGAITMIDNTWSAGLWFSPFAHGIDVSVQAATKYIVGHSDALLGTVTTTAATFPTVKRTSMYVGTAVGPDDCYLALRGLRTLAARMERHQATALRVATWLTTRPEVVAVLYPPLPSFAGYALWRRDFTGANGLVSLVLAADFTKPAVAAMLDGFRWFRLGASWGGHESLVIPFDPRKVRTVTSWPYDGLCLRLHCGLEDADDLIADLADGFDRLNAAA